MIGRRLSAFVVIGFLAIQAILPGLIMWTGGSQFRWAMFESYRPAPRFLVETAGGVTEVELANLVVRARGDIDYVGLVPPYLCARNPAFQSVSVEVAGSVVGTTSCLE